jgi:hypothetical protein
MNKKRSTKKYKASVLVVTMILLGLILLSALSMSVVSLRERRASMGDVKSQLAFQNAETGAEKVLDVIIHNRTLKLDNLPGFDCDVISEFNNATLSESGDSTYVVELKKFGYDQDNPSTYTTCSGTFASDIVSIKSIGTGSGQQRAIEAAVIMAP